MPPVVWFTSSYVLGVAAGRLFVVPVGLRWLTIGLALLALATWVTRRRPRGALSRLVPVLALALWCGVLVGAASRRADVTSCAAIWPPGRRAAVVRWHDAPSSRGTARVTVLHAAAGCAGPLSVRVREGLFVAGVAGARAAVVGEYRGNGVLLVEHVRVLSGRRAARFVVREAVAQRVARLYGDRAPIVEALVLGRRDALDPDLRRAFVDAGLAHLLAISGLHVGMIAGWLGLAAWVLGAGARGKLIAGLAVWPYVLLLGFPAPATRAAAFTTLFAVSRWRQRHPSMPVVLSVAALVVLAADPASVTSVGAWLSVTAVWGTWAAGRLVPPAWRGRAAVRLVAASVGATVATAPITAFAFGTVAPVGVFTNLVAVPLVGLAVPAVFVSLALGAAAAGGGLALAGIEVTANLGAAMPGGHMNGVAGWWFALPWIVVFALFGWLVYETIRTAGARAPRLGVALRSVAFAGGAVVWCAVLATDLARRPSGRLDLFILDVGQGDAIAVRTPAGRWLLVDAGPLERRGSAGRRVVVPFLARRGATRLELFVASHGDADHLGGAPDVLEAFEPRLVLEPGLPLPSQLYQRFLGLVDAGGTPWQAARAGDTIRMDGVTLAVLHPTSAWMARRFEANEASVVLHVRYGCFDALLTGDIGRDVESQLLDHVGEVEVLKVAHHGSATSTTVAWLDHVQPEVAVLSVGRGNRYGHPAPDVLERLRRRGIEVRRTDEDGTVTISTDGEYFEVKQNPRSFLWEWVTCRSRRLLPLRVSSSSRSACIPVRRATSPICSTTSPSRPR